MAGTYGTTTTLDTLETIRDTTVIQFGEQRIYEAVQNELDIVNAQLNAAMDSFAERTQDNMRADDGAIADMEMVEVDEFGTPDTQKTAQPTENYGFPLRRFEISLQWTRSAFERMTPAEIANTVNAAIKADRKRVYRDLKRALFAPTNYTFIDKWGRKAKLVIPVKALANADGWVHPFGPNGEVFAGGSHNHYMGTASLVAANVTALWQNVAEHYTSGQMVIYINQAQEAALRAMTSNFTAFPLQNIQYPTSATLATGPALTAFNTYNRAIGMFDQAVVWVKPWVPSGYLYAFNTGARKVLALRTPDNAPADFRLVYEDETHPLRARIFQREYGMAVQERLAAAVLYTGNATYAAPNIT
jgi:hypothetical protein